jgi:hypothetical protein
MAQKTGPDHLPMDKVSKFLLFNSVHVVPEDQTQTTSGPVNQLTNLFSRNVSAKVSKTRSFSFVLQLRRAYNNQFLWTRGPDRTT